MSFNRRKVPQRRVWKKVNAPLQHERAKLVLDSKKKKTPKGAAWRRDATMTTIQGYF